jgi:DNA-binding transcriptional regulator YiaG
MTGEDVRDLRGRMGLNKTQFAHKLGTSQRTIRRWESGQVKKPSGTACLLFEQVKSDFLKSQLEAI